MRKSRTRRKNLYSGANLKENEFNFAEQLQALKSEKSQNDPSAKNSASEYNIKSSDSEDHLQVEVAPSISLV